MPTSEMFKPLEARRAFEAVTEQVKGLVYSGQLKPGDKLPTERELATLFGTGRMVVRECLGCWNTPVSFKSRTAIKVVSLSRMWGRR